MCRAAAHIVVWIMLEERAITVIAMTREMGSLDIRAFWAEFLVKTDREHNEPLYDIFHFDDNASDANELAELVQRGKKPQPLLCFGNTKQVASVLLEQVI